MNLYRHSPRSLVSFFLSLLTLFAVSCASVGNNFDESKISEIKKGQTTETDLVGMFGPPQNRSVNSDTGLTLTWIYSEAKVKGESFIPYAGAFMGGTRSKSKTLSVMLADNKVTSYTYSGGGTETRNTTQDTPKN
jgi:hypothetical protein